MRLIILVHVRASLDNTFFFSYPREQAQGAAFERIIAPVDLILYFECSNVSNGDELTLKRY